MTRLRKKIAIFLAAPLLIFSLLSVQQAADSQLDSMWEVQSIDTVKYSRDVVRENLTNPEFDQVIDLQISHIADTGATHVAIGTPYDPEFLPFLRRWVAAARKQGLNVWFRGNLAGWEGWFGYKRIGREEHLTKIRALIEGNPDLFAHGDIFSSCPECENGGPGDPRRTLDIVGYRLFLIKEYMVTKEAFAKIGKQVKSNYFSMNGDVARLIMDRDTTQKLDGLVTIDHYVASPDRLTRDIKEIARLSGGKIVLGEFGAPIPDINGQMNEADQAKWVTEALEQLSQLPELIAVNYWTSFGASTNLWNGDSSPRQVVTNLTTYFNPISLSGVVMNELKRPIRYAYISSGRKSTISDQFGRFTLPLLPHDRQLTASATGYRDAKVTLLPSQTSTHIPLVKEHESLVFKVLKLVYRVINPL